MNIFVLDEDPIAAARYHCDRHVVKMILESAQMLSTVVWCLSRERGEPVEVPYKPTHDRHPCTLWVRESRGNFNWLVRLAYELGQEHLRRYNPARPHASLLVVDEMTSYVDTRKDVFLETERTEFVQCVPDQFRHPPGMAVEAYRAYYRADKQHFATWKAPAVTPKWY